MIQEVKILFIIFCVFFISLSLSSSWFDICVLTTQKLKIDKIRNLSSWQTQTRKFHTNAGFKINKKKSKTNTCIKQTPDISSATLLIFCCFPMVIYLRREYCRHLLLPTNNRYHWKLMFLLRVYWWQYTCPLREMI